MDEMYDYHHRRPKAQGGRNKHKVLVRRSEHVAWHTLFPGHMNPHDIARSINRTWIDPSFEMVIRRRRK